MSSVTGFVLRFSRSPVWQNFDCSCRISIFLINYTDEGAAVQPGWCLRTVLSLDLSIVILILTINQIHDRLLEWTVGGGNLRPSVVTSLTSTSSCIICWWKTYLDCMNNNTLCLTLCCDMHFIYWPQLDFCIDFADTVCLRRFFMDFPAAIPNDPLWSLSVRPSSGTALENSHHFHHHVIPGSQFVHQSDSGPYCDSTQVWLTHEKPRQHLKESRVHVFKDHVYSRKKEKEWQ